jgi:hypothetical protein
LSLESKELFDRYGLNRPTNLDDKRSNADVWTDACTDVDIVVGPRRVGPAALKQRDKHGVPELYAKFEALAAKQGS